MNLPANPAAWAARWKELWAERAAIIEYDANVSRLTAETRATLDIRKLADAEKREERTA